MQLPSDSIGISDILTYRECPRKFSYGMRRHIAQGEQDDARTQEARRYGAVWAREYGSAIHHAIERVEQGDDDETAIQSAWNELSRFLEPGDVELMREDLRVYHARDFPNTRLVASEEDARVPLMRHRGKLIYFRFKLDRLYERLDAPGTFIHVDYKSSRHAKSNKEVREDLQLWAYNWGIHELYPEVEQLEQVYEQLRYGQIDTRKTPAARAKIKDWLIKQVTAILEDEDWQDDGMLPYQQNQWCEWCPIMESCGVVTDLTDFALVEIAAMAPVVKEGRKRVTKVDQAPVEEYVERLARVKQATGVLKRFDDAVSTLLKEMPGERRGELGYELRDRGSTVFTSTAKRQLHDALGDQFYDVVGVTKTAIENNIDDVNLVEWALSLGQDGKGSPVLQKIA